MPYAFPAGLGIIAAIMRDKGNDVYVYDQNALRTSNEQMLAELKAYKGVDVIGAGGLITTYSQLKSILPALRNAFPKATIVLGGGVTVEPKVIFNNMPVDFCVHGEGEHTFPELCSAIRDGGDTSQVLGISFVDKRSGKIVTTPPRPIEMNLDRFPMPAYDLFPSEIYFNNNVLKNCTGMGKGTKSCATLLWSRGCPNKCSFCWRMMGRSVRFRSVELVMEEIDYLRSNYGVDAYLFFDECINASRKRTMEFARELINRGFAAPWYSHARVTNFDVELAEALHCSGCVGLNFGIESGSQKMLDVMKKNTTPEVASRAVKIAKKANIGPHCTFIIGMPGETKSTVFESIKWVRKNKVGFSFFFATPYPGCDLYENPLVQERIHQKYGGEDVFFSALGDVTTLTVNMTDFTDSQLKSLKDWAEKKAREPWLLKRLYLLIKGFLYHKLKARA